MDEIKALNEFCAQSMIGLLGITFTAATSNSIQATMPVSNKTTQPNGFLHGGASLALAETLAGAGSYILVDREKFNVFGMQISGNHVSTVTKGVLTANARLIHQGKTTHIWDVKITADNNKLISTVRVTNMVVEKKKEENE
ncbi:PaaI family thioesterase [Maribellus sediminis]|uniref:PaaI family thioesterase n=1 Tax=Maribellus sediminis TaxID=2696285 RepID=UPI00143076ED|nr:PaaI family thioesterase [Maribellus sediminis]